MSRQTPNRRDLRGTWLQALTSLVGATVMILAIRWAFFEPYVIPSGSMIPTLLIHDHIMVNKFAYGVRTPFTSRWLVRFGLPKRGDVIVFRSVEDDEVFLVKRVIGLPGDHIETTDSERILVNGKTLPLRDASKAEIKEALHDLLPADRIAITDRYKIEEEDLGPPGAAKLEHFVMASIDGPEVKAASYIVPKDSLFMMGDNRDNSSDSRFWGPVPADHILGRASMIWLSCQETLPEAKQLCDPSSIRWDRIFKGIR